MVLPFDVFRVVSAYARHLYVLQDTYKLGDVAAERVVAGPNLVPWILSRTCDLVRCCKDLPTRKAFYIWKIVQSHCDPTVFFALGGSAGVVYSFPPLTELATLGFRNAAWLVMETVPDTERNLLVLGFLDRLILFSVDQRQTLSTVTCESSLRVPHIDLAQMASVAFLNSTIGAFVVGRHVQIFCISKNEIQILHRIVGPRSTARANPLARFIKKAEPNQTYELFVYDGLHWCRVFPNAGRKKTHVPGHDTPDRPKSPFFLVRNRRLCHVGLWFRVPLFASKHSGALHVLHSERDCQRCRLPSFLLDSGPLPFHGLGPASVRVSVAER